MLRTISHRKTLLSVPSEKKPFAFFAYEDDTKNIFFCTVVAEYSPMEGDGTPDVVICTEIDRNDVRRIAHMSLEELSVFMRMNMDIYTYMSDRWRPHSQPIVKVKYENVPDVWWPTSIKRLDCKEIFPHGK